MTTPNETPLITLQGRSTPSAPAIAGGTAFFESGFRPFFFGAAAYAVFSVLLWVLAYSGLVRQFSVGWHGHEMIYGFATAAISGFLLTAVPNWTRSDRFHGAPLQLCFAAWLLGRLAMVGPVLLSPLLPPSLLAPGGLLGPSTLAAIDLMHLPILIALVLPRLVASRNARNAIFPVFLLVLIALNALHHFGPSARIAASSLAPRASIYLVVVMVLLVASRVVPAFTRGTVERDGYRLPEGRFGSGWLLTGTTPLAAAVLLADLTNVQPAITGALSLLVAALLVAHLSQWGGLRTLGEPIVWILHAGYALLALAFFALGASQLGWGVQPTSALHAFSAGAIGTMVLAIMTRAALGHGGRPLRASRPIAVAYVLVLAGGLLRVFGPVFAPGRSVVLIVAAGLLWASAYALFLVVYTPILLRPRADGKPG